MSKYTTEIRFLCETFSGYDESQGYKKVNDIIKGSLSEIFDFNYPIFDENYRESLEIKILKHYYTREIGQETYGLWKLKLETKLNEIMPYYNQLYESELLKFNPLYEVDLTRNHTLVRNENADIKNNGETTRTGIDNRNVNTDESIDTTEGIDTENTNNGNTTIDGNTDNTTTVVNTDVNKRVDATSQTPQGSLENLESLKYLTEGKVIIDNNTTNGSNIGNVKDKTETIVNDSSETNVDRNIESNKSTDTSDKLTRNDESNSTQNETRKIDSVDDYIEHVTGKSGSISYSKMLMEFRQTFLNIDLLVISELSDLFFGLW